MLIEQAREILDAPSAVRFVRDSLGPLLQGAMDGLNEALAGAFAGASGSQNDAEVESGVAGALPAAARNELQPGPAEALRQQA